MASELHKVQASILRELLFKNGTNFASLNKTDLTSDHFNFHVKQLISDGVIEKKGKSYFLTQKGKQIANKLDTDGLKMEKFGTPSITITVKKVLKGIPYYLVQQRLKEPFYGYYGFINGKVRFGEMTVHTAERELEEETGLKGKPLMLGVAHKLRGPSRQEIKLDHFFFLYLVKHPKGILKDTEEGKNTWKTLDELRKLQTFPGFHTYLDIIEKETYHPYFELFAKVQDI